MATFTVSDDAGNTVHLRQKLKLGQMKRFQLAVEGIDTDKPSGNIESVIAMLTHYVTDWSGPAFAELGPFDASKVEEIDSDAPIIAKAVEAVAALYAKDATTDPKSNSDGGSTSAAS